MESIEDLTAPWTRHGAGLAERMLALADQLDAQLWQVSVGAMSSADLIRAVIRCDYDPLPLARPQLGAPPTVRPAVPPKPLKPEAGS